MVTREEAREALRDAHKHATAVIDGLESLYDIEDAPLPGLEAALRRARMTRDQVSTIFRALKLESLQTP